MTSTSQNPVSTQADLLVAFGDITLFARTAAAMPDAAAFKLLSDFYEMIGDIVEKAGGKFLKPIGDAALVVFPDTAVDAGVRALVTMKARCDEWMEKRNLPCRLRIGAHFGPVACGPLGSRSDKRFDIIGNTVNIAARLRTGGIAISPQVFRKLKPDTRRLFKKHTPPVTYIPVGERHESGVKGALSW